MRECDLAIIGGGASGLAAAYFAAQSDPSRRLRIVLLEATERVGTKILVSGGGRCNVAPSQASERDYWGTSRPVIRNVLRSFGVTDTLRWLTEIGVEVKLEEETGKYFPATDSAATVRNALVRAVEECGCEILTRHRVTSLTRADDWFHLEFLNRRDRVRARRVILAAGGKALPKSGSDGGAYELLKEMGHKIISPVPALVPLVLARDNTVGGRFHELAGISVLSRISLLSSSGAVQATTEGSVLFTHFGVSGPAVLDISRHVTHHLEFYRQAAVLTLAFAGFSNAEDADVSLRRLAQEFPRKTLAGALATFLPFRLAQLIAGSLAMKRVSQLSRQERTEIAQNLAALPLRVIGHRGFECAEVTAGGVDLREVDWRTMESRYQKGLHLCGEILDVDGRLGGFNFQWAWSSAYLAGQAAAKLLLSELDNSV